MYEEMSDAPRAASSGLLTGGSGGSLGTSSLQIDGHKIYSVKMFNKPFGLQISSGALGHVVTGIDAHAAEASQVAIHSRLLRIESEDVGASPRKEVDEKLANVQLPVSLVFERPERFDVSFDEQPFDFHYTYTDYGHQLHRIEKGEKCEEVGVPLGSHIAMVNGTNLIYESTRVVRETLKECQFPCRITFTVFGSVVNRDGNVIVSQGASQGGIGSAEGQEYKSNQGAVAVQSNPLPDSRLRRNERKEKYPILKVGEWLAFLLTLVGMILLISALAVDHLLLLDAKWSDGAAVEDIKMWFSDHHFHAEATITTPYVFDVPDEEICDFPTDHTFYERLALVNKEGFFEELCGDSNAWKVCTILAIVITGLVSLTGIVSLLREIPFRKTTLLEYLWGPGIICLLFGMIFNASALISYTVSGVDAVADIEDEFCKYIRWELYYQTENAGDGHPQINENWDECSVVGGISIWLGATTMAVWIIALCCMCSSWLNTPRTCCYVGDNNVE